MTQLDKAGHKGVYHIDIATGEERDLGLVAPWSNRRDHGPPAYRCFVGAASDLPKD